ncbi:hypothetical protein DPMN_131330 [Dreissena polymorpha]|uniref:Uncharacterized protein n=1 Tax=Dreissena polymorpha TaxID=45954 RepID=A0A9D4H9F1_DREPO|nr:hypothetical protein DPMN_131330 [Dreissena polymorpha]
MNEEFLVSASQSARVDYVPMPFVHNRPSLLTDRSSHELFGLDPWGRLRGRLSVRREDAQVDRGRGRKSRNKVIRSEPSDGSLPI